VSSPRRAEDPDVRAEALRVWAVRIAADFPVPGPDVADRLVNLLLPRPADRGSDQAEQGA